MHHMPSFQGNARRIGLTAAVTALVFGLAAGPLSLPIWAAALLAGGGYAVTTVAMKPKRHVAHLMPGRIGADDDAKRLLDDAQDDLLGMERSLKRIGDAEVRGEATELYRTAERMVDYLSDHPERIGAARKFLAYYLDTARHIVERYATFERTHLTTETIGKGREEAKRALPILKQAFDKQFTQLMSREVLEIEADVKLLEQELKMDP